MPGFKVHEGTDEIETVGGQNGNQYLLEGVIVLNQAESKCDSGDLGSMHGAS